MWMLNSRVRTCQERARTSVGWELVETWGASKGMRRTPCSKHFWHCGYTESQLAKEEEKGTWIQWRRRDCRWTRACLLSFSQLVERSMLLCQMKSVLLFLNLKFLEYVFLDRSSLGCRMWMPMNKHVEIHVNVCISSRQPMSRSKGIWNGKWWNWKAEGLHTYVKYLSRISYPIEPIK